MVVQVRFWPRSSNSASEAHKVNPNWRKYSLRASSLKSNEVQKDEGDEAWLYQMAHIQL